ncbi:MAG: hypothetical protein A2176_02475 [Spirochaetes bacterium RBG_13_51_14]|nr:MAG: hypothetical protein A2176_02475 [Spirochaetes bacterium RBG_13_51_14]
MGALFTTADFDFFKSLIVKAGDAARQIQSSTIQVTRKSDATIVTQADLMVQDMLIDTISARYDDLHFINEEQGRAGAAKVTADTVSVIIDPIDGTAMYSMYLPIWCVSIGIFRGYTPVYGFVYSPGFNMLFYNDDDKAYLNDTALRADTNIRIDTETNIFYASEVYREYAIEFPGKVRNLGSTALHACLTVDNARNRTLAFIGKSRLWDWAGAIPVVLKAGGSVRYIDGRIVDFRNIMRGNYAFPEYIIAYNSRDFTSIRKIFKKR